MADRKISDLTALTAPASGDYLPIVDISEAAAASKNKRITIEELFRGIPLGTAAAPSIAIEGDEDTGIYSPGANQLAVATNGTGRLFVASNGNVGIGTGSPGWPLHVVTGNSSAMRIECASTNTSSSLSAETGLLLKNTDTTVGNMVSITVRDGNNNPNTQINFINTDQAGSGAIGFTTSSGGSYAEKVRIDPAGRVGIGTASPATKFQVTGSLGNFQVADNGCEVFFTRNSNSNIFANGGTSSDLNVGGKNALCFYTGSTLAERARIDSSGRLGIGTTSPSTALHTVYGPLSSIDTSTPNTTTALTLAGSDPGSISAGHGTLLQIRGINGRGGVVGIGAVAGSTNKDNSFNLAFYYNNGNGTISEGMRLDSSGRLGIGTTSPGSLLHVAGKIRFGGSATYYGEIEHDDATTAANIYNHTDTGGHIFKNNGQEALRIDSSKRLLVGTSTSIGGSTLQIAGTGGNPLEVSRFAASNAGSFLTLLKSRGATVGANTVVAQDDLLGAVQFSGADGSAYQAAANIRAFVDGATVSSTSMPGRLVFSTTADGASSPTERMRLTSTGQLRLAGAGITFNGDTAAANELDDYEEGTWTPTVSFNTPGDLSVTYTTQAGDYVKIGRLVVIRFIIETSSFTHTTASGKLRILGLPFTRQNLAPNFDGVALSRFRGITASGFSQFGVTSAGQGTSDLTVVKSGSGATPGDVLASDVPTGGTVSLIGQYTYPA